MADCPAKCIPGTVSASKLWVESGAGCPVQIDKTATVNAACVETVAYSRLGVPWTGSTIPVAQPTNVTVCSAQTQATITVTGADCAGVALPVTGLEGQIVRTVPHPTAVQLVKLCPTASEFDREFSVLCDPVTGQRVATSLIWNETAPLGTPPTVEAYQLNGALYTGNVALLVACSDDPVDSVQAGTFCAGGVQYTRTDFWSNAAPPALVGSQWQDISGAVVPAPAGAVAGVCSPSRRLGIYIERNGGTVSMSDIVAATGSDQVMSVSVVQITGTGNVGGDSGSSAPLRPGQSWSWSAISGSDFQDTLSASSLKIGAGGGENDITATYVLP